MPLRSPNLDDRSFEQLVAAAKARAKSIAPDWELSPSDPGTILMELFAHLTEILIYRLNRVPEKAYIEFLGLLGLRMQAPTAASVELVFSLSRPAATAVEIPRGVRVTVARSGSGQESPVFMTARAGRIEPGETETTVTAYHGEWIEGEFAGHGTGAPRLSVTARRAPIVAATAEDLALVVGVEAGGDAIEGRAPSLSFQGSVYRVWSEVETFTDLAPDAPAYVVDRLSGAITFAPAIRLQTREGTLSETPQPLAAVPERGRAIRLWYWRGGGEAGNVAAGALTVLKDPIPGVSVNNPDRASGGRAAETLENALLRGPEEFRSLERAVTASDFEILARRNGAVSRVKAVTQALEWAHATPGTVEVLLVPEIPDEVLQGPLEAPEAEGYHAESARAPIARVLNERKPLGTNCLVNWARYKTVRVRAKIAAYREEDEEALRKRVLTRLYRTLNPTAWRFGQALRASHVYDIILAEPGVEYVEDVSFTVEDVPARDVTCISRDAYQPKTWHAASGDGVYRTVNDGEGWERTARFPNETVTLIAANVWKAGLLAAVTSLPGDDQRSALYFTFDDGETWSPPRAAGFEITDVAWMMRENVPVLLVATTVGLYEISMSGTREPVQILVDPGNPNRGFQAVTAITDVRGGVSVAVAARDKSGVFLSSGGGGPETFQAIGLTNENIRVLATQYDGPRAYLWAGFEATGGATGTGAARIEIWESRPSPGGWTRYSNGWRGGSCWSLSFQGLTVHAGSFQSGALRLDTAAKEPEWEAPDINVGLPQRGVERIFQWVRTVAASPAGVILCGGPVGVYRSVDGGAGYRESSSATHREKVTLPETWLFCSGRHDIVVAKEVREGS
ncbi:MAG: baseplate J/gp47 family protein [Bryobacteraceae bacterium]|nr:baseplate J/gp47 family protein [Bryobacteraceae bacterium]